MFVDYRFVCLHVCLYLLVHVDPADRGRCCGFPSAVEEKRGGVRVEGESRCGLGSRGSDHRQFALRPQHRPVAVSVLWRRSQSQPHTHQTWQVNDGAKSRVLTLNEGHTTTPQPTTSTSTLLLIHDEELSALLLWLFTLFSATVCGLHLNGDTRWSSLTVLSL